MQVTAAGILWGTGGIVVTHHVRVAATVATPVEPLSAPLLAAALLAERLAWSAVIGGVLILGAVVALRPTEEHPVPP